MNIEERMACARKNADRDHLAAEFLSEEDFDSPSGQIAPVVYTNLSKAQHSNKEYLQALDNLKKKEEQFKKKHFSLRNEKEYFERICYLFSSDKENFLFHKRNGETNAYAESGNTVLAFLLTLVRSMQVMIAQLNSAGRDTNRLLGSMDGENNYYGIFGYLTEGAFFVFISEIMFYFLAKENPGWATIILTVPALLIAGQLCLLLKALLRYISVPVMRIVLVVSLVLFVPVKLLGNFLEKRFQKSNGSSSPWLKAPVILAQLPMLFVPMLYAAGGLYVFGRYVYKTVDLIRNLGSISIAKWIGIGVLLIIYILFLLFYTVSNPLMNAVFAYNAGLDSFAHRKNMGKFIFFKKQKES